MMCDEKYTNMQHWQNWIPYDQKVYTESISCFKDFIVIKERIDGLSKIKIDDKKGATKYIEFDDEACYQVGLHINPEFDTDVLRLTFSSLRTPLSIFQYNIKTSQIEVLKITEVVGGHDPNEYITERILVPGHDRALIPVSIVYNKSMRHKDIPQALLLYGYGSYGISMDPSFSISRKSLLDRGFVFAIAHIRGGEEMGRQWYEDGKLFKKQNTFSDFISVAERLIELNYTNSDNLYAKGGSAGGLLMGAIINQRPELWKAVIAAVPFVDVITTMLDDSIPLTTGEYDEWGNPNDPDYFNAMLAYSPYDQVAEAHYPALLITTGFHDSQVQYWEPLKWIAKLRVKNINNSLLLFYCNMDTGHGGDSGRYKVFKEIAMEYAFLIAIKSDLINT